jgi:hypothetical protein
LGFLKNTFAISYDANSSQWGFAIDPSKEEGCRIEDMGTPEWDELGATKYDIRIELPVQFPA